MSHVPPSRQSSNGCFAICRSHPFPLIKMGATSIQISNIVRNVFARRNAYMLKTCPWEILKGYNFSQHMLNHNHLSYLARENWLSHSIPFVVPADIRTGTEVHTPNLTGMPTRDGHIVYSFRNLGQINWLLSVSDIIIIIFWIYRSLSVQHYWK